MALCNPLHWLKRAQDEGFAIGAFNANTIEQAQAIVNAAEAENAPVFIQVSHRALQYMGSGNEIVGMQYVAAFGKVAAQSVRVPVALHLDHATEQEVIMACALGFTSVMFDGSLLSYEENVAITKRLAEITRSANVCLEAELGEVPKPHDPNQLHDVEALTDPEEASAFVNATGIDTLAVALGSVHGVQEKQISLDLHRLQSIKNRVDIPLVLHGSSGVEDVHIQEGIRLGLRKINVATQMNGHFTHAVRKTLQADEKRSDPRPYLTAGRDAMQAAVQERLRFFGASGKA